MRFFIPLPFLLVIAVFGQSDYVIDSFSKSIRAVPPASNQIIQPLDSGTTLKETKTFPNLGPGEVVMRMRFAADDHRMYHGKFSTTAFDPGSSLFSFTLPAGMSPDDAAHLKFYREKSLNPNDDEPIIFFDRERIYVKFLPTIYYHRDTGWQSIDAVNLKRDEKQARPVGDISITSEPPGAKIFIDGEDKGVVTPNYATDLFAGDHTVRVELKDFQPAEKKVTVKAGSFVDAAFTLVSALGAIQISSDPPGATVTLNSVPSGTTPLTLNNIKPGRYAIGLNKDLYVSQEETDTIAMNHATTVSVTLKPNFGTLVLPQPPSSASWTIDSKPTDSLTARLNPGKHHVTWNGGEEYSSIDTIIDCPLGITTTLAASPRRLTGSIKVMPLPPDAEIFVNDKSYGAGAKVIPDLPTGSYTVVGKKEGYKTAQVETIVKSNETETAKITLEEGAEQHEEKASENTGKTLGMEGMVLIPGGSFTMGSPAGEGIGNEHPQHNVTLDSFYMDKYLVTQAEYERVMGSTPSHFQGCPTCPVENVSWNDAKAYCEKVGKRLPTEAEWEYAARAGSTTKYYWGNDMNGDYAWYNQNSDQKTHPVGQKKPNGWGLYDMSGNVWEWCGDWYGSYGRDSQVNPTGQTRGIDRVLRGGSWLYIYGIYGLRSAVRYDNYPVNREVDFGFRCVRQVLRGSNIGMLDSTNRGLDEVAAITEAAIVFIASYPIFADIYMDGKLVGKTNTEIKITSGTHTMHFVKGDKEATQQMTFHLGKNPTQYIRLQ